MEGCREKSHYCVARYLERYVSAGQLEVRWVGLLDHYREQRHESQYRVNFVVTVGDAQASLKTAKEFVDSVCLP